MGKEKKVKNGNLLQKDMAVELSATVFQNQKNSGNIKISDKLGTNSTNNEIGVIMHIFLWHIHFGKKVKVAQKNNAHY